VGRGASLFKTVLITQGANDAVVKPTAVEQHKAGLAHAQIQVMANVGHAAFWGRCGRVQSASSGVFRKSVEAWKHSDEYTICEHSRLMSKPETEDLNYW